MFYALDEISIKLDWPLKDATHNQLEKVERLLKLRQAIQLGVSTPGLDGNKLTKQLSFYGITQFLYELIKLNKIFSYMFNKQLMFNLTINDCAKIDTSRGYLHEKILKQLEYTLDLWSKLNEYKDVCNVITKCLTNCKLDNTNLIQEFLSDFYYLYKFDATKPYMRNYLQDLADCPFTISTCKKKMQYISYLFHEKSMYKVILKVI
jgi:hypothetical protein